MGEEELPLSSVQGLVVSPVCLSLLKDSLVVGLASPSFLFTCVTPHPGRGALFQAKAQLFPAPW